MTSFNRGDIIQNKGSGISYVVLGKRQGEVVAARLVGVTNPTEWEAVTPHLPSDREQEMEGDLRQLVAWIDSVIAGHEPHIERGSSLFAICERWRS